LPPGTTRSPTTKQTPSASFPANRCFAAYIPPSPYTGELSKHSPWPRRCPSAPTLVPLKLEHGGTSSPTRDRRCHSPHTSSLPQGGRLLGADLNCSESSWTPDLLLGFHRKNSTRDPGRGPLHCGILIRGLCR